MRFFALIFVVLCLVAAIHSSPAGDKKKKAQTCPGNCGDTYEPVCAKEVNGKKMLKFGNTCVLERFNCEHPDGKYEVKPKTECGANVSERLA